MSIISMQSQVKKNIFYRQNAQHYIFLKKHMAAILYFCSHQNCVKFKSTHTIQADLLAYLDLKTVA